jgi:hypothetical protein
MADYRKQGSLLEKIYDGRPGSRARMKVPEWWQDRPGEADEPPAATDSSERPKFGWLGRPVRMRVSPGLVIVMGLVAAAMIVTAYELGRLSAAPAAPEPTADEAQTAEQLREGPINAALMKLDRGEADTAKPPVSTHQPQADTTPEFFAAGSPEDPREVGYNYYCVATVPAQYMDNARRAVQFLEDNEVDAAVVSVQDKLQIVVLRGFDSPTSTEAKRMEALLRGLGRVWAAEHRGGRPWDDLYPMKYTGS